MSEQVNSVAGQLVGIPCGQVYTAGKGIKIDNVNKVVTVDETVLWEGTIGATGVTSATLSEPFTNFEKLEVWWAQQGARTLVNYYYTEGLTQMFCLHGKAQDGTGYIFMAAWSISGTTASKVYCKYKATNNWANLGDANELCPCKIIGINRISGGN